jgi:beta-ureidopropionase / N-carbamoyl-L-amino-acid hydrolase
LRINGNRLWQSIMDMAVIGATNDGHVCRLALTDADKQARDLFVRWCRDAGCRVGIDRMGNIFARRPGKDGSRPPVLTGSHLDTQPPGGRFDGAYGVMAGLEVIRTLNDLDYVTEAPVEVVVWTNGEGQRFFPSMVGSGVFSKAISLDTGLGCADGDGKTVGEELKRIGYSGDRTRTGHPVHAFLEAHLEQGPVLEKEERMIGVATGAFGLRWYEVEVSGEGSRASFTPMQARRDALVGAARIVAEVNEIGNAYLPNASATVGELHVEPNSRNVVPGNARLSVDLRHSEIAVLDAMEKDLEGAIVRIGRETKLDMSLRATVDLSPTRFAPECIGAIREEAEKQGIGYRDMVSVSGHDACYLARVAPAGMIFIRCSGSRDGVKDLVSPAAAAAGCNVLLGAVIRLANR